LFSNFEGVDMTRITVSLHEDEKRALQILAEAERRHPREQAAVLIRCELERRGMLAETAVLSDFPIEEMQDATHE
jgi:hypothetical protein